MTEAEFARLRAAIDDLPPGTDATEALGAIPTVVPDGWRYQTVEVKVRKDCAFLPVMWRNVKRWATEDDVARERPPL